MWPTCSPTWIIPVLWALSPDMLCPAEQPTSKPHDASKPYDARETYRQARTALEQDNLDHAVELLESLYAAQPAVLSYGLLLADTYLRKSQPAKARSLLAQLAARPPDDLEARILLAQLLARVQRWKDIVNLLDPAGKTKKDYRVHHLLAEARAGQKQWTRALDHYRRAIDARPEAASDHKAVGDIHFHAGRHALAANAYLKANQNGINTRELAFRLATAFHELGNNLGNIRVQEIKSTSTGQLTDDGYLLSAVRGRDHAYHVCPPQSALYQIQRSIKLGGDTPPARYLRGNIWLKVGSYQHALDDYRAVEGKISLRQRAEYHANRARAHLELDQYDDYIEHLKLAAKATPQHEARKLADAYLEVAVRYQQRGDLENYLRYLRQAARIAPSDPTIHHRLGFAYWDAKETRPAVEHWRIVLELVPDFPQRAKLLELIKQATTKKQQNR